MRILVVNAGSSSLKLRLLDERDQAVASVTFPPPTASPMPPPPTKPWRSLPRCEAIGHRIVHGGGEFTGPVVVDEDVVSRLKALSDLAPLHQPKSLAALDAVSALFPAAPAVACFDTAFHARIGEAAATYALPLDWRERWGSGVTASTGSPTRTPRGAAPS